MIDSTPYQQYPPQIEPLDPPKAKEDGGLLENRSVSVLSSTDNKGFSNYSTAPDNTKNVAFGTGATGVCLAILGLALIIAALATMIIPLIAVAASLLVIGIVAITVIITNKSLRNKLFHVIGITADKIDYREKRLDHCNLVNHQPGFQQEDKSLPRKVANTIFVAPNNNSLTLMATPNMDRVDWLSENNYKTIVAMQEDWEQQNPSIKFQSACPDKIKNDKNENIRYGKFKNPRNATKDLPTTQYLISTPDRLEVSFKNLDNGVELVKTGLEAGNVAVHCKSGVGRSAKVIASYLHKYQNLSIEGAINAVYEGRSAVRIRKKSAINELYKYACALLKEKSMKKSADSTKILREIKQLRKQMDDHISHYKLEKGNKAGAQLKNSLDEIFKTSGLYDEFLKLSYEMYTRLRK